MYDIRGADGTGTSANPVLSKTTNARAYTVRKLADGNCWMTENLALPLVSGTAVEASSNTTATPYSFTPTGTGGNDTAEVLNNNTKTPAPDGNYYYSWYAATAGTGTYAQTTETAYSICPTGWRLPANYTIVPSKSIGSITNAYGLTTNAVNNYNNNNQTFDGFPISFARNGCYTAGSPYASPSGAQTQGGYYWSSTASSSDSTRAYELFYNSGWTAPQYPNSKFHGFNIRCVAL